MENAGRKIKRTLLLRPKDPWSSSHQRPPQLPSRDKDFGSERSSLKSSSSAPPMVTIRKTEDRPPKRRSRSSSLGDLSAAALERVDGAEQEVKTSDGPPRMPQKRGDHSSYADSDALSLSTFRSEVGHNPDWVVEVEPSQHFDRDGAHDESEGNSFASGFDFPSLDDDDDSTSHRPMDAVVVREIRQNKPHEEPLLVPESPTSPTSSYAKHESVLSVETPVSNLTSNHGSRSSSSTADGNFEMLTRDCSFWEMRPGQHDSPQIQRKATPVVISEDNADLDSGVIPGPMLFNGLSPYRVQHLIPPFVPPNHQNGFASATSYNVVNGNYNTPADSYYGQIGWENAFSMPPPPNSALLISRYEL